MERKACTAQSDLERMLDDETAQPKALPLSLLEDITGYFSDDREIGRGGFAVVYKGIIGNRAIAVKRLSNAFMNENEFHREVQCLMRANHKNVVRFLGYCANRQGNMATYNGKLVMADVHQRLLCFNYIPKGSLDKYILDANREWGTCYKIIKGICEGVQYLHENHIIHLDLKPANILLDDDMAPKITDFGLSRCFDENQSRDITKTILGTMGYLAPELREGGVIARSADLFSLGVIIIEILTGQKGYQSTEDVLESWSGRLERSQRDTLCIQIRVCYEIALECRDFNPKKRPASARDIIDRLHEMESILNLQEKKIRENSIGILKVGILGARDLVGMKNPYCVTKYGEKWVRTRTLLNTAAPRWNEQYTWDVFDVSTVITVAIFDDLHLFSSNVDERIGKVRIHLGQVESDRVYANYYPLVVRTKSGTKKTGELQLAFRFTCKSWTKMLGMYGKPLLPDIHYSNPVSMPLQDYLWSVQQDHLRFHAVQMTAKQLERNKPPIRREVVDSYMFSLRRSKANLYRLKYVFSDVVAMWKWFRWKNPLTTVLVHVVFLSLVCYPELILPMVFLYLFMIGLGNYGRRSRHPQHFNVVLSCADQACPDEMDEEFDTLPPPYMDTLLWYPDQTHHDELNEFNASRPDDIVRMRYDRLRSIAGRVQTVVGDLAVHAERVQSLFSWSDPRATPIFITLSLLAAVVLYLTPFRVVAMVTGLYFLLPPWLFRNRTNQLLINLYGRLPSKDDVML